MQRGRSSAWATAGPVGTSMRCAIGAALRPVVRASCGPPRWCGCRGHGDHGLRGGHAHAAHAAPPPREAISETTRCPPSPAARGRGRRAAAAHPAPAACVAAIGWPISASDELQVLRPSARGRRRSSGVGPGADGSSRSACDRHEGLVGDQRAQLAAARVEVLVEGDHGDRAARGARRWRRAARCGQRRRVAASGGSISTSRPASAPARASRGRCSTRAGDDRDVRLLEGRLELLEATGRRASSASCWRPRRSGS